MCHTDLIQIYIYLQNNYNSPSCNDGTATNLPSFRCKQSLHHHVLNAATKTRTGNVSRNFMHQLTDIVKLHGMPYYSHWTVTYNQLSSVQMPICRSDRENLVERLHNGLTEDFLVEIKRPVFTRKTHTMRKKRARTINICIWDHTWVRLPREVTRVRRP